MQLPNAFVAKKRLDYHKLGSDLVWISIEQYMASPQISSPGGNIPPNSRS